MATEASGEDKTVVKSGVAAALFFEMDDTTFKRHFRLTRTQFDSFASKLRGLEDGAFHHQVQFEIKVAMFLWYMANQNSFREIGDRFNVSKSTAHDIIFRMLDHVSGLGQDYVKWPDQQEKETSAGVFRRLSGKHNVIGAIDGCHIRIQKPQGIRGDDYMNRKGYFSILLQGICDDEGKLIDYFIGPPGRLHDARMLKESDFFQDWQAKMENYFLLGDSAYISAQFPFIITPKRDNGTLTDDDVAENVRISRGRVIIENVFGRMKCRWRRLRDLQNSRALIMVQIIMASCVLHNLCMQTVCDVIQVVALVKQTMRICKTDFPLQQFTFC